MIVAMIDFKLIGNGFHATVNIAVKTQDMREVPSCQGGSTELLIAFTSTTHQNFNINVYF